jgi:hypothetical protein
MANKHNHPHKDKKRKGHVQAELLIPKKIAIAEGLDQEGQFWDDWSDYRDSMRNWYADRSRIYKNPYYMRRWRPFDVEQNNKKLKIKEKIRKVRKNGPVEKP